MVKMLMTSRVSKHVCTTVHSETEFNVREERRAMVCYGFIFKQSFVSRVSGECITACALWFELEAFAFNISSPTLLILHTIFFWTFATFRFLTITSIPSMYTYTHAIAYAFMLYLYEQRTYVLIYSNTYII